MTIRVEEGMYFLTHFMIHSNKLGPKMDVMGVIYKEKDNPEWHLKYRFRYHKDDKVWDSKDEKSWFHATTAADIPELEMHQKTMEGFQQLADLMQATLEFDLVQGDHEAYGNLLLSKDYANHISIDAKDAKKYAEKEFLI